MRSKASKPSAREETRNLKGPFTDGSQLKRPLKGPSRRTEVRTESLLGFHVCSGESISPQHTHRQCDVACVSSDARRRQKAPHAAGWETARLHQSSTGALEKMIPHLVKPVVETQRLKGSSCLDLLALLRSRLA